MATTEILDFCKQFEDKQEVELAQYQTNMIHTLTDEQVWEIRHAFTHFDKNSSGTIGTKELGSLFRTLGQNLSDEELLRIIIRVDLDHDGVLDFPEFLHLMGTLLAQTKVEDSITECFRAFDTQRTGKLDVFGFRDELTYIYSLYEVPENDVSELFDYLGISDSSLETPFLEDRTAPLAAPENSESDGSLYSLYEEEKPKMKKQRKRKRRFVTIKDFMRWLKPPKTK